LTLARYNDNPFQIVADRYHDFDSNFACFGHGNDYHDDLADAVDYYYLDWANGSAETTMKSLNKARVILTAGIVDEDQNSAGTLDARFTVTRCEVRLETDSSFALYLHF